MAAHEVQCDRAGDGIARAINERGPSLSGVIAEVDVSHPRAADELGYDRSDPAGVPPHERF